MNIRKVLPEDFKTVLGIINESASAYKGVIEGDCWKEPYMPEAELMDEVNAGVVFWCAEEGGRILGVMGIQDVQDVSLIRHSYVRTAERGKGIGKALLSRLMGHTGRPVLAGTWAKAGWAVNFYESNGFTLLSPGESLLLLSRYWKIPARQAETSVVLGDQKWRMGRGPGRN